MYFFCLQVDGPIKGAGRGALKSTNDDMHLLVTDNFFVNWCSSVAIILFHSKAPSLQQVYLSWRTNRSARAERNKEWWIPHELIDNFTFVWEHLPHTGNGPVNDKLRRHIRSEYLVTKTCLYRHWLLTKKATLLIQPLQWKAFPQNIQISEV